MEDTLLYPIALTWLYRYRLRKEHLLLDHYGGSAAAVWHHLDEQGMDDALCRAQEELEWIDRHDIRVYVYGTSDYPYRLQQCPDAPILLYGKGELDFNQGKMVSVVGTRSATDRGREMTRKLVLELAAKVPELTIVSGLAYGIDVAAHKAAIEADIPTIIVPGHGLDRIYPSVHRQVAVDALRRGGILTEYMSQTEPDRFNFVARDRIIAGLADAVLVVESKARGGALLTAQMAVDYNRQLFAVPGRATDDCSRGTNQLIRDQKAALIETADDLIAAMSWETDTDAKRPVQTEMVSLTVDVNDTEQMLLDKLREDEDGIHINLIVMECQLPYSEVSATLMMMELKGLVKSLPGGMYRALK